MIIWYKTATLKRCSFDSLQWSRHMDLIYMETLFEPRHDKTNEVTVRPAKTLMSLGIRAVWSASSLCAQRIAKGQSFLHAVSEDSDQTGRIPRLILVIAGRTVTLLVLSCRGSLVLCNSSLNRLIHGPHHAKTRLRGFSNRSDSQLQKLGRILKLWI